MNIFQTLFRPFCKVCGYRINDDWKKRGKGYICLDCFREKNKAHQKEYYHSHKEQCQEYVNVPRIRDLTRKWYELNKEYCKQKAREYYRDNTERCNESVRNWRANNPEKIKLLQARNRCRRRSALGDFSFEEWKSKLNEYNYRCAYCGIELSLDTITIDHVIPLISGGTNYIENLVPSCIHCNCSKNSRTADEFLLSLRGSY